MNKTSIRLPLLTKLALVVLVACSGFSCVEDTSCGQNNESDLNFSFYSVDTTDGGRVVTLDNSELYVFEPTKTDTVYPRSSDDLTMVPLQLTTTITDYDFQKDSVTDRIRFYHSLPIAGYLDINCGFSAVYTLDSLAASTNFIDSIYIVNPEVNADVFNQNIYVFYTVSSDTTTTSSTEEE